MLCFNTHLGPESKLQSVPFQSITISAVVPVPGLLFVHTPHGLCLLHPGNLQPVAVGGLTGVGSPDTADLNPHIQFKGDDLMLQVVKVYDVEGLCTEEGAATHRSELCQPEGQDERGECVSPAGGMLEGVSTRAETRPEQGGVLGERQRTGSEDGAESITVAGNAEGGKRTETGDYGSCCVAFSINNRLLVLAVSHRYVCLHILCRLYMHNHDESHLVLNQDGSCEDHT